jgi:hypothetical protein
MFQYPEALAKNLFEVDDNFPNSRFYSYGNRLQFILISIRLTVPIVAYGEGSKGGVEPIHT